MNWLSGLAFDGEHFVTASRTELLFLSPEDGRPVRRIPVNSWIRTVEADGGALWLMEQPIFGFDRKHQRIRTWPEKTMLHRLTTKPAAPTAPGYLKPEEK